MLEICCFNIESVLVAQAAGADRIELCADAASGGTTQSLGTIRAARDLLAIPLYPIIRPRAGDFLYNEVEFQTMMADVTLCKQIGCDGIVLGILNSDGNIDKKRCSRLIELAYPLGVTFHRAFDLATNPLQAMEDIIEIGCERILTSGGQPTAKEGSDLIRHMVLQAATRIEIMPGSGVRAANIATLAETTNAKEFHSSARTYSNTQMRYVNEAFSDEYSYVLADPGEIMNMRQLLAGILRSAQILQSD